MDTGSPAESDSIRPYPKRKLPIGTIMSGSHSSNGRRRSLANYYYIMRALLENDGHIAGILFRLKSPIESNEPRGNTSEGSGTAAITFNWNLDWNLYGPGLVAFASALIK